MFLLRSMFWLTVAYVVMQPQVDLRQTGESLSTSAVAVGQQVVLQTLRTGECASLECQAGKVLASAVLTKNPSSDSTMQDSHSTVPIPRPRPHWMG
jgi:hypothetical protein